MTTYDISWLYNTQSHIYSNLYMNICTYVYSIYIYIIIYINIILNNHYCLPVAYLVPCNRGFSLDRLIFIVVVAVAVTVVVQRVRFGSLWAQVTRNEQLLSPPSRGCEGMENTVLSCNVHTDPMSTLIHDCWREGSIFEYTGLYRWCQCHEFLVGKLVWV